EPLFWNTFKLIGILLAANLFKMWPCIFAAVVLHRLRSEKWQYFYRVLLVIPMVVPSIVTLLIWKSFFDPTAGILNSVLQNTGMMALLHQMDTAMPALADTLIPVRDNVLAPVFGNTWGLGMFGLMVLSMIPGWKNLRRRWVWLAMLAAATFLVAGGEVNFLKGRPSEPLLTSVRPLLLILAAGLLGTFLSKGFVGPAILKWIGGLSLAVFSAFVLLTMIWTEPTRAFGEGTPAWLGNTNLIIPAVIFWGFPWVGTIGVLIYLAGLQGISSDVYEAAELDGVGSVGKLFKIELPLILAQVRINLIFMTIGTLTGYDFFLLLLGPEGGPDNKGMVPGLYMYREAFFNQKYGYACALGMVMFVIVLAITIFYQKYVKVEK
ncbi:MAG: hypothetical protein JXA11_01350, partial [Phycisphaerae bacterium]|nr:hypothetical protein [Phycisphaerae bacterium]